MDMPTLTAAFWRYDRTQPLIDGRISPEGFRLDCSVLRPEQAFALAFGEAPFDITPNPRFLFYSAKHREAYNHLLYGIRERKGFVQLTGEIGTGKTTLCRCLLDQLPPHVDVALILNPKLTDIELLATVCDELGIAQRPEVGTLLCEARRARTILIDLLEHRASEDLADRGGRLGQSHQSLVD